MAGWVTEELSILLGRGKGRVKGCRECGQKRELGLDRDATLTAG